MGEALVVSSCVPPIPGTGPESTVDAVVFHWFLGRSGAAGRPVVDRTSVLARAGDLPGRQSVPRAVDALAEVADFRTGTALAVVVPVYAGFCQLRLAGSGVRTPKA